MRRQVYDPGVPMRNAECAWVPHGCISSLPATITDRSPRDKQGATRTRHPKATSSPGFEETADEHVEVGLTGRRSVNADPVLTEPVTRGVPGGRNRRRCDDVTVAFAGCARY